MDVSQPNPRPPATALAACAAWFGAEPPEVGPALGTGFSGSPLLRVRPRGGGPWFVLKAFAAGAPRARATWVHALVRHLAALGIAEVPVPRATSAGETIVTTADGLHWELVPFVAGVPNAAPSVAQSVAALGALARLHAAAAVCPGESPRVGVSPGVARRIARARELAVRPWRDRRAAADPAAVMGAVGDRWDRAIEAFELRQGHRALAAIAAASIDDVPLQAVLRDVWSDHVLFAGDEPARVAGIVDVHAAGVDAPATDLARLLGSWRADASAGDPLAAWPEAVAAYAAVRGLSSVERRLVPFLHASAVVCGLDNWFRWTCEERRGFAAPAAVLARIDRLLADLPAALEWLAGGPENRV